MQQTKQELLKAYLDVTHAVTSSLSDALDDQAPDPTAALPIIHQVHLYQQLWLYINTVLVVFS